jgi:crooked neck
MADGSHGAGRVVRPKNRAPAPIQITAEQILVESRERAEQAAPPAPKRHITDPEELAEHRMRVRKEYEDRLRRLNKSVGTWLRYAKWEEGQGEVARARSIYERTLDVDPKEPGVWLRYAEMEMRAKFINRARNVLDRATALLPRVEALWFKYVFMEEMLGNVVGARALFERWMTWEPEERAWLSYANLELRAGSTERARGVYERYVACHPSQVAYLKYAKWEARNGQAALARRVLERALDELRDEERDAGLYAYFAKFEQECGEAERARAVFRLGLVALGEGGTGAASLHAAFLAFEKQHGSRAGIEEAIITKRRGTYEAAVGENPLNFDAWFDWVHLEESEVGGGGGGAAALSRVRDVFERAIANVPPIAEKRYWRRYVYLWLGYAVFEELVAKDGARARAVYKEALKVVPHRSFTFGKLWLLAAHAEVRAKDVGGARKLLGAALGMCPKPNIIQGYIELELALGELDRVRKLYERYVTLAPGSVVAWLKFAELERSVGETERARAIYDLAIGQTVMDRPELAWKAAIGARALTLPPHNPLRHLPAPPPPPSPYCRL